MSLYGRRMSRGSSWGCRQGQLGPRQSDRLSTIFHDGVFQELRYIPHTILLQWIMQPHATAIKPVGADFLFFLTLPTSANNTLGKSLMIYIYKQSFVSICPPSQPDLFANCPFGIWMFMFGRLSHTHDHPALWPVVPVAREGILSLMAWQPNVICNEWGCGGRGFNVLTLGLSQNVRMTTTLHQLKLHSLLNTHYVFQPTIVCFNLPTLPTRSFCKLPFWNLDVYVWVVVPHPWPSSLVTGCASSQGGHPLPDGLATQCDMLWSQPKGEELTITLIGSLIARGAVAARIGVLRWFV